MAEQRRERGWTTSTLLVAIGAAAWMIAWFVPAASLDSSQSGDSMFKSSADGRPFYGFHAFLWAAQILPEAIGRGELDVAVLGATSATNFVMLAALMLHRFVPWARALGFAVLVCALLNTTWLFLCEPDMVAAYRVGYYLWLASFGLAGLGIVIAKPAP